MSLKHQEQVLSRDLGAPDDLFYSGTSAVSSPTTNLQFRVETGDYGKAYILYFQEMGKRQNQYLSMPNYLGNQIFDSTTNPVPKFNYCRNSKLRLVCHPHGMFGTYYNIPTYTFANPFWRRALPVGATAPTVPELIDWHASAQASNRAWWEMQPRFQGDFDGLNFLFELKDFKNIAKHLVALRPSNFMAAVKNARGAVRRAQRSIERGTASQQAISLVAYSTRAAAEALLTKRFAIDPTIRDMVTLHAQLANLISDVQHRFREKGKTVNRRHYSETISEEKASSVGTKNNYWYRIGSEVRDKFTATLEFTYDYKMRDTMDALKRYYGGEMNAGVVWNALPFSFLLDYVIQVGDAIDRMTLDPNVLLTSHQYCESRLITARVGMMHNADEKVNAAIINGRVAHDGQIITGYEGTLFERRVVPPRKGVALPKVKMPSVKQAQNIVALVRCMW